jgi:hypothetical protein
MRRIRHPDRRQITRAVTACQLHRIASIRLHPITGFRRHERRRHHVARDAECWPLGLLRREGRVAVAQREVTAAELSVADRGATTGFRGPHTVWRRARGCSRFDRSGGARVGARRQYDLLSARVEEGASPPLDRDLFGRRRTAPRCRSPTPTRSSRASDVRVEASARHRTV